MSLKIKKNLLFATGVFLITIVGLLAFPQGSKDETKQSTKLEVIKKAKNHKVSSIN